MEPLRPLTLEAHSLRSECKATIGTLVDCEAKVEEPELNVRLLADEVRELEKR